LTKGSEVAHDWILNRGVKFSGRVVDDELDTPVPGARIVLWTTGGSASIGWGGASVRNPYHGRILEESTSGTDGVFTFEHAPGLGVHLQPTVRVKAKAFDAAILADGYAPAAFEVDAEPAGSTVERVVRLRKGATVRGRVLDEMGKPLSGVTVFVPRTGEGLSWIHRVVMPDVNRTGATAGDGTYEIRGIPASVKEARTVKVGISADVNRLRQLAESSPARREADVEVRAGQIAVAPDLVLPRAVLESSRVLLTDEIPIDVTIVDADGNGIAGALLQVVPYYFAQATVTTDSDGKGRIVWNPRQAGTAGGESLHVQVTAPGYAVAKSAPFELRPKEPVTIRLSLTRARLVKGIILRADGSPANAASIRVYPEGVRPSSRPADPRKEPTPIAYTVSREDGSFELNGLPEAKVSLTAQKTRRRASGELENLLTTVDVVPGDATEVTLRFTDDADAPAGVLELEVRDAATGKPIPKFGAVLLRGLRTVYAASGVPGRAVFDNAVAGVYELRVSAEGYALEVVPGVAVDVHGRTRRLVKLGQGAVVRGTLRAPDGVSPDAFDVMLSRADRTAYRGERQPYASIDKTGVFRIERVSPGTYAAIVVERQDPESDRSPSAKWAIPARTLVQVGEAGTEASCELDVVPGGTFLVRVTGNVLNLSALGAQATQEQLELAAGSRLTIRDSKGSVLFELTGLDDRASWERPMPEGELTIRLEIPGREPLEQRAVVTAGKRAYAVFDVR
jgi:hypothetical protein